MTNEDVRPKTDREWIERILFAYGLRGEQLESAVEDILTEIVNRTQQANQGNKS